MNYIYELNTNFQLVGPLPYVLEWSYATFHSFLDLSCQ